MALAALLMVPLALFTFYAIRYSDQPLPAIRPDQDASYRVANSARPSLEVKNRLLENILRECDAGAEEFRRHRHLAQKLTLDATRWLRAQSPLLHDTKLIFAGSAFDGAQVQTHGDFDTYVLLGEDFLQFFELETAPDAGGYRERLRPGLDRAALFRRLPQLRTLVDADGHLNALRFKQWAFGQLTEALRHTAARYPQYRPVVYQGRGAAGMDVTAADGGLVEIDYAPVLAVPDGRQLVYYDKLSCRTGATEGAATQTPEPLLYSKQDVSATSNHTSQEQWFAVDPPELEKYMMDSAKIFLDVDRLLKVLKISQKWRRFDFQSFILKHAIFWTHARTCREIVWDRSNLLQLVTKSLETLQQGLERGRLDEYFFRRPANILDNMDSRDSVRQQMAAEIGGIINTLQKGRLEEIRRLFQL